MGHDASDRRTSLSRRTFVQGLGVAAGAALGGLPPRHAAAEGKSYECFVRPDTRIPFMAMPDGVEALLRLADAPVRSLTRTVYNIGAFNPSAEEIRRIVVKAFPRAEITTKVDLKRQAIVDSWPEDVDDSAARRDWGLSPCYDLERAFSEYLIPTITKLYA